MSQKAVDLYIMGREYRVVCTEQDQESLIQASHYLDLKMREIREQGKVIGTERVAVMAALNIAFEMLNRPAQSPIDIINARRRIHSMESQIDELLRPQDSLFGADA